MGHHPLNRDLLRAPAPAAGNGSGLGAEAVELGLRWGLCPWIGHTAHAGTRQGDAVAIAAVGVSRQIHVVIMQPVHTAITADDRVIVPRADPVLGRCRPVQVERWGHGPRMATIQRSNDAAEVERLAEAHSGARRRPHRFVGLFNRARR